MTATNHGLSGALIGLTITQPALALPLAFVSHFILDAVPHFGDIRFHEDSKRRRLFHIYLFIDAVLLAILISFLFISNAGWLALACLFMAGSPDFVHAYQYLFNKNFYERGSGPKKHWFTRFHKNIQWSETQKGLIVEIPFAILLSALIINLV